MLETLKQYVLNAVSHPASAGSVALGSIGSGISTVLKWLPPVLGVSVSVAGLILTIVLIRKHDADRELMLAEKDLAIAEKERAQKDTELKEAQIKAISERKEERG
jgi:hypothetical protein